ncbi:hypothetical protein [Brevundimonas diminuta]|uniref:hypothetical protein n=1 Tax=Brevundimonas diminuta TaxID=293 RepID=UPI003D9A2EC7
MSYSINKAADYGFYVVAERFAPGEFREVLCAGDFDECVAFIRSRAWPANKFAAEETAAGAQFAPATS